MEATTLELIRCSNRLSDRELALRLGSNPSTVQRWISGYTSVPAIAERLIDHELGDGTPGSALKAAEVAIRETWQRFVIDCPAPDLALVAVGYQAVEFDPDSADLFDLSPFDEHNMMQVHVGDTGGVIVDSLEAIGRLLNAVGREDDAREIHHLIIEMDQERLGAIIAPLVGAMEREEMLGLDIFRATKEALVVTATQNEEHEVPAE